MTSDIDKLPSELRPSKLSTVTNGNITAFYTSQSKLSNHFLCLFTTGEGTFSSAEQNFMYQKDNHFADHAVAKQILESDDPVTAKALQKKIIISRFMNGKRSGINICSLESVLNLIKMRSWLLF